MRFVPIWVFNRVYYTVTKVVGVFVRFSLHFNGDGGGWVELFSIPT
jgi:hypothetical protein